jgi:predicted nucleic-acid-binding protein
LRITADTNVLLRAILRDDQRQAAIAEAALSNADLVAISNQTLCEFAWVLRQLYKRSALDVAATMRTLIASERVVTETHAVEAGLAMLDAGGDFADGVIAFEGVALGADSFVSFDKKAVTLLVSQGANARLLT